MEESHLFFLLDDQRQSVLATKEERRRQRQAAAAEAVPASLGAQLVVQPAAPAAAACAPALALAEGWLDAVCGAAYLGGAPSTPAALVLAALACGTPDVPVLLQQRGFAELREGSPLLAEAAAEALRALLQHRGSIDGSPEAARFAAAALAARSLPELTRSLLVLGADPNERSIDAPNGSGSSSPPLLVAALMGGHLEEAEVLLDAGARPDPPAVLAAGSGGPAPMQLDCLQLGGLPPNKRPHGDLAAGEAPAAAAPTPLVLAVAARSPRLVARLLTRGADPNRQCTVLQPGGSVDGGALVALTPLLAAVHTGSEELVQQLLAAGADVHQCVVLPGGDGADWSSPLSAAVLGGSQPVVELLVEAGAAGPSSGGGTAGSSAGAFQPKHALRAMAMAAQRGQLAAVRLLYPRLVAAVQGGSPALLGVLRRRTTLHPLAAAAQGGHAAVVDWLLAQGAPASHSGSTLAGVAHQTALMLAAGSGHLPVVQCLLAAGADPRQTNAREETAAVLALRQGHLAVLRCLLLHGGEMVEVEDGGVAAAEGSQGPQLASACRAWQLGFGSSGRTLLGGHLSLAGMDADRQRFRLLLLALLGAAGGSAEAAAHLRHLVTPASVARAAAGSEALLDALLAAGCSLACVDPGGGSFPLLAAAQLGWEPMLRLLRRGADPNQTDASGNTVLMLLAARPSLLDTARCLLTWRVEQLEATAPQQQQQQQQQQQVVKQGLDVLRLNAEGRDALGVALAAKNRRCAEELLTHLVTVGPPAGPLAAAPAAAPAQHAGAATAPAAPTAAASPAAVVTRAYEALVERSACQLAHINLPARDGQLLLLAQARSASRKQLRQVLAMPGLDFNVHDGAGRTALHLLVGRQNPALVADLLAAGQGRVELEARDVSGATAALLAARGGATGAGALAVLLAAGADPDCFDAEGRTLLMALAATGQHKLLSEVLQARGAAACAVDRRDVRGWTALHHAAAAGAFGACRVLRAHGASPQARTFEGQTPADLASGNEQCLALLRLPALGEAVDV